jgi:hypothetical protein
MSNDDDERRLPFTNETDDDDDAAAGLSFSDFFSRQNCARVCVCYNVWGVLLDGRLIEAVDSIDDRFVICD